MWDAATAVFTEKIVGLNAYVRKRESAQVSNLRFPPRKGAKEEQSEIKSSRKNKIRQMPKSMWLRQINNRENLWNKQTKTYTWHGNISKLVTSGKTDQQKRCEDININIKNENGDVSMELETLKQDTANNSLMKTGQLR